jgi:hypothetical protein
MTIFEEVAALVPIFVFKPKKKIATPVCVSSNTTNVHVTDGIAALGIDVHGFHALLHYCINGYHGRCCFLLVIETREQIVCAITSWG